MTTPLISMILPTFFFGDVPFSAMGLLERDNRRAQPGFRAPPNQRLDPNEAPSVAAAVAGAAQLLLRQRIRHPGGVVEVSAVRGDSGSENHRYQDSSPTPNNVTPAARPCRAA